MTLVVPLQVSAPAPADAAVAGDRARSDFERVGGEAGLRPIIAEFVASVFADAMIGFLFAGKPRERIAEYEYRFAAEHLGGPVVYDGRSLREAHRRSPISGGHFARRRRLLEEALVRHAVPDDVRARWLASVDAQRGEILGHFTDACER